ncbi:MAG: ATP-binding protein [Clostridium sp.]
MKIKKSLLYVFTVNYLAIIVALIISVFIFAISFMVQIIFGMPEYIEEPYLTENTKVFADSFDSIDREELFKAKGWIEKVQNGTVVEVIGEKKDSITNYTIDSLINDEQLKETEKKSYKIDENSNYIVKVPYDEYYTSSDNIYDEMNVKIKKYFYRSFIISAAFLIFSTGLMAFISIRNMSKPLKKIKDALKEMTKGNYDIRLDFNTYKEIDEIKNSFNYMVQKLKAAETQKTLSEESKKRMIRDISHDIKTPITSIMGYSKALIDGKVESEDEEKIYLGYIYNKTLRLNYLVNELFTFAKLDSPNYKLNIENHDLSEFLRELVVFYYGEIEQEGFELDLNIPEKEVNLNFDAKEMERAIGNLIINALKYNPKGTKLEITLKEYKNLVKIYIKDNGIGMDREVASSIFEEFTRGDASRVTTGGSGIGLSITKKIIRLHNGNIQLRTEKERGTEFIITLIKE